MGTRMREETEFRPKPMVEIGGRPVLWHIMKNLSLHGITEFVIACGYKGEYIKNYFLNYQAMNSDFTVRLDKRGDIRFHGESMCEQWTVSVIDTGVGTMTGGRLGRLRDFVGAERFLCTYGDGLADVDVTSLIKFHESHGKLATITVTQPSSRFGIVEHDVAGVVHKFREKPQLDGHVNIGFFIFEAQALQLMDGDDCVLEQGPLTSLTERAELAAFEHKGFWQPMDTYREYQQLNQLWSSGVAPWKTWE